MFSLQPPRHIPTLPFTGYSPQVPDIRAEEFRDSKKTHVFRKVALIR